MQSQIETLQEQLKERANDTTNTVSTVANFDDPQWMLTFMDELKNRAMKGTSTFTLLT